MLLNCGVGEDSWESLEIQPVHPKGDQSWVFIGRADVEAETPILWSLDVKSWLIWKVPDAGKIEGRRRRGRQRMRCWMASPTQWTWVWVNSGSWWWTRRLGVLRFMGSQRVRHDWVTELNWTDWLCICIPDSYVKRPWLRQPFQTCSCDMTWHPLRVRTWGWLSDNALWLTLLSLSHRHNSGDIGHSSVF